jgi:ATPase family associated with various cellular activities (AAA)
MIPDILKGSALVAFVVGFWDKIKTVIWQLLSVFVQRVEVNSEEAHETLIGHLVINFERLPNYDRIYGAQYESFKNGRFGLVPFEKFGSNSIVFLTNKKFLGFIRLPFYFSLTKLQITSTDNSSENTQGDKIFSTITCLRGSLNFDKIFENAIINRNKAIWNIVEKEATSNRFNIIYFPDRDNKQHERVNHSQGYVWFKQNQYRLLGIKSEDLGREKTTIGSALDNLFFPDNVKELISVISLWVKSKDWYKSKSIPWKRGWLLYGPPGTGKTALARAFAEDLDLPIYFFSLAQMSNSDLINAWQTMQLNIPCIALIEDIDNVFDKRKNICQNPMTFSNIFSDDKNSSDGNSGGGNPLKTPLTFDTLLNCIDGVDKSNGVFTIITTNDISKIDSAIGFPEILADGTEVFKSTRPGRIDKAIELTYMSKENKRQMAEKILSDFKYKLAEIFEHIEIDEKETPAQFQEYCSQIALQEFWKKD